jgi:hypothetical protein
MMLCVFHSHYVINVTNRSNERVRSARCIVVKTQKILSKVKPWRSQGCEKWKLPHFLGNRLIDGGEVVSLMRRQLLTPQEDSWYTFLL